MNVSPITSYNRPSFGNAKQQLKSKAKQLAIPLIGLSTLAITPSCDNRKPYNECTRVEADSLYRQEHAEFLDYSLHPNWVQERKKRNDMLDNCPCSSCDSARTEIARQDSIASIEREEADRLQQEREAIAEAKRIQAEKAEAKNAQFCKTVAKNITKIWNNGKLADYLDGKALDYIDGKFVTKYKDLFGSEEIEHEKVGTNKWSSEGGLLSTPVTITINKQSNGDYDVIYDGFIYDKLNRKYSFTKDHRYKDEQYYAEAKAQEEKAHFDSNSNELVSLPLFNTINQDAMSKISSKLKIDNIEYIEKGKGVYNLFFNKDGMGYDLLIKNTGNGSFAGMARKLLADGGSEMYIFKTEHFETNKSDKIRVSKMLVIQDGLDDNAPTTKKGLHETRKTGNNVTYTTTDLNGKSRINMIIPAIPNFFAPGRNYDGKATANAIQKIDELITESNTEGKVITVYSCPKNSDVVEMNGRVMH